MADAAVASNGQTCLEESSQLTVEQSSVDPAPASSKPRHEVSLAELLEHFASLQHDYALFKEGGKTRPPTAAVTEAMPPTAAPLQVAAVRQAPVAAVSAASKARPNAPRSQSVPPSARMRRNTSPGHDGGPLRQQHPPSHQQHPVPSARMARPSAAAAGLSPAANAVAGVSRWGAERQPHPEASQQQGVGRGRESAAAEGAAGKPPVSNAKKKKKKAERPPWRDDFVEEASPWSRELAEEAAATEAAAVAPAVSEAAPQKGPGPQKGLAADAKGRRPARASKDGAASDAGPVEPAARPAAQPVVEQRPARRTVSPGQDRLRAAAVAAAKEAGLRQQQLLQQQGAQQQVARGGMMLVIPSGPEHQPGPPTASGQGQGPPAGHAARSSPVRGSHIPVSPGISSSGNSPEDPRRSESRPRTQQSRIPTYNGQQQQAGVDRRDATPPREPLPAGVPARGSPGRGPLNVGAGGGGNRVDRLVLDPNAASLSDDSHAAGPAVHSSPRQAGSSAASAAHHAGSQQRRRRQWDLPGAAGGSGGDARNDRPSWVGSRVSSDGHFPAASAAIAVPVRSQPHPQAGGGGAPGPLPPTLVPTPPSGSPPSRPSSRPGSRPSSRPVSTNGEPPGAGQPASGASLDSHSSRASTPSSTPRQRPPALPLPPSAAGGSRRNTDAGDQPVEATFAPVLAASPAGPGPGCRRRVSGGLDLPPGEPSVDLSAALGGVQPRISGSGLGESTSGGGAPRSGPGPPGLRHNEDYLRKLSALKRPVPLDAMRRVTEDALFLPSPAVSGGGAGSGGGGSGGSAGPSRKWMDAGNCDAPLSAAPVDAVGSAPAAVRAARNRVHSAEVYGSMGSGARSSGGGSRGVPSTGGAAPGEDAAEAEAGGRSSRNSRAPKPQHHMRHNSDGVSDLPVSAPLVEAPEAVGAASEAQPHDGAGQARVLGPLKQGAEQGPGAVPAPREPRGDAGGAAGAGNGAAGVISAEQYMAFAVQNPDVAMAAAQAAMNVNSNRARPRWNLPPEHQQPRPQQPVLLGAAGAAPPWGQPQLQLPMQQPLAAALVSSSGLGGPTVSLPSPGPSPQQPHPHPHPSLMLLGDSHDLRRVNSEGPRAPLGRQPGAPMLDLLPQQQSLGSTIPGAPSLPLPASHGPLGPGAAMYGAPSPPLPVVQGLFQGGPGGVGSWPGEAPADGGGRLGPLGAGPGYPPPLQPVRSGMLPPGDMWAGGPGMPPPPQHMQPPLPPHMQLPPQPPPQQQWGGYVQMQGSRGYMGGPASAPGPMPGPGEAHGPPGSMPDPYSKPPAFKRASNGYNDGQGGPGPGFGPLPPGVPGPGPGPPGGGPDLPDYMRVSMSRMVAGWSAPNAKHGALSGFNDVWQYRNSNNNRLPPSYPGPGLPTAPGPPTSAQGGMSQPHPAMLNGSGRAVPPMRGGSA
ncbi:hypothetical protein Agub_g4650, partial [Astrephomene gubernaculifera]